MLTASAARLALPAPEVSAIVARHTGQSTQRGSIVSTVPPDVVKDFAPTGTLRVAINLGNSVLAQTDKATGKPRGITVDLAGELGRRLGLTPQLTTYRCRRQGVRGAQGERCLGRGVSCYRAGARGRDRVHGALRHHRGQLHGAEGLGPAHGRRR